MNVFVNYESAFWGVWVVLVTMLVQALVASVAKALVPGTVPGKIDDSLGHSSFVFRSNRTVMNSLENVSLMLGTLFLAVLVGANAWWVSVLIWVYAVARILHMILYYVIATDQNPSPRSYFYLIGLLSNVVLIGFSGVSLWYLP